MTDCLCSNTSGKSTSNHRVGRACSDCFRTKKDVSYPAPMLTTCVGVSFSLLLCKKLSISRWMQYTRAKYPRFIQGMRRMGFLTNCSTNGSFKYPNLAAHLYHIQLLTTVINASHQIGGSISKTYNLLTAASSLVNCTCSSSLLTIFPTPQSLLPTK